MMTNEEFNNLLTKAKEIGIDVDSITEREKETLKVIADGIAEKAQSGEVPHALLSPFSFRVFVDHVREDEPGVKAFFFKVEDQKVILVSKDNSSMLFLFLRDEEEGKKTVDVNYFFISDKIQDTESLFCIKNFDGFLEDEDMKKNVNLMFVVENKEEENMFNVRFFDDNLPVCEDVFYLKLLSPIIGEFALLKFSDIKMASFDFGEEVIKGVEGCVNKVEAAAETVVH